jgi:RNA polymerase sigma factor (sigma-70 family)
MKMTDGHQLLAEYVKTGSEPAFRELVVRYVDLVYSASVRLVDGDTHRAEDVTQTVFIDLARVGRTLSANVMLGGWLHRHTCFVAATVQRGERRRQARERQAVEMNALKDHSEDNLAEFAPLLDEAINQLADEDRAAILLRFFEQLDFKTVGAAIGSTEDAAKKRVSRALEKLHGSLTARGISLSTTTLATALAAGAVKAAPAGLVSSIVGTAVVGSAAAHGVTFSFLKIMTSTKVVLALTGTVIFAGVVISARQYQAQQDLRNQNDALRRQIAQVAAERDGVSNRLTQLNIAQTDQEEQLRELLRLRAEVASLKRQVTDAGRTQPARLQTPTGQPGIDPQDQQRQMAIGKMREAKVWVFAFHQYAQDHQMQFPTSFDQLTPYLESALRSDLNPGETLRDRAAFEQSTNQFELAYQGAFNSITNWAGTIVMREKEAWPGPQGGWNRTYGFADGHTEIHHSDDGNFTPWESNHLQPPASQ